MDVIKSFALSGSVELTDEALLAVSTMRKFEVAFRNEDLESLIPTIALGYNDGIHQSRTQLINGVYNLFNVKTVRGVLDEWNDTVDPWGGPLAGFSLDEPLVTFSDDGNTAFIVATATRLGYRGVTEELEISVPADPTVLVDFTVRERDFLSPVYAFYEPVPTTMWITDVGDHRGVLLYIDKAFANEFGFFPNGKEFSDEFLYEFKKQGSESFQVDLPANAEFRLVFASAIANLSSFFPADPRPLRVKYIDYFGSQLVDIELTFTITREGPRDWKITNIAGITELIPVSTTTP
jgi:hypothetical protein